MIHQPDRDLLAIWAESGMPDDVSTREHALVVLGRLWESHCELEATVREIVAKVRVCCDDFRADEGGAHPWCQVCGWHQDLHTTPADPAQGVLALDGAA